MNGGTVLKGEVKLNFPSALTNTSRPAIRGDGPLWSIETSPTLLHVVHVNGGAIGSSFDQFNTKATE
jgi:hypothetical protein